MRYGDRGTPLWLLQSEQRALHLVETPVLPPFSADRPNRRPNWSSGDFPNDRNGTMVDRGGLTAKWRK
jgi:hypothetical protein